jgi:hypothetical protein
MGTKIFDHGMMTYQHAYGKPYTIPIYCWYLEGGDKKILVDTGEMQPIISPEREAAIGERSTPSRGAWPLRPEPGTSTSCPRTCTTTTANDSECVSAHLRAQAELKHIPTRTAGLPLQ